MPFRFLFVLALTLVAISDLHGQSLREQAEATAELRRDVARLGADLTEVRELGRAELLGLQARVQQAEAELSSAQGRRDVLISLRDAAKTSRDEAESEQKTERATVAAAGRALTDVVVSSLPFAMEARRAALESILVELEAGRTTPLAAARQLWRHTEDALRASIDVALIREPIALGGEPTLADVVHFGGAFAVFRTGDGRHGVATPSQDGRWIWSLEEDPAASRAIDEAIERVESGERFGRFEIPTSVGLQGRFSAIRGPE